MADAGLTAAATAKGGDINLQTSTIQALNGGIISASTLATGQAGNMTVQAQQIDLSGEIPAVNLQSGLFAQVLNRTARGNAGTIAIQTDRLNLTNGAQINTSTTGLGQGGNLQVNAQAINLSGTGVARPSGLFSRGAGGAGGAIHLTTDQLNIFEGAQINSSAIGPGNGGMISIHSNHTEILGTTAIAPSGIFSTVSGSGSGNAGEIHISGDSLLLAAGAQIATATSWSGKAGDIFVNVGQVELAAGNANSLGGLISTSVLQLPPPNVPVRPPATTGAGGTITVNADRLFVRDGAVINVSNFPTSQQSTALPGNGAVGNIIIQANSVLLDRAGTLTANSRGGDRGNITINSSQSLTLRNGSRITTNTVGNATGGNININTNFLVGPAIENADITANAQNNFGGRVIISAQNVLGLQHRSQLTPESDITATSSLGAAFDGVVDIQSPNIDPETGEILLPIDLTDPSQKIARGCEQVNSSQFIITGRGGIPIKSEQIGYQYIWADFRKVVSDRSLAKTSITRRENPKPVERLTEAIAWQQNAATGETELLVAPSSQVQMTATCALSLAHPR